MSVTVGSLFSGIGGLDMAVESFFGAQTAWHCEVDPEPSKVLAARWPGVPNLGDVTAVDWSTVEPVDIMCGGFPCQDLSLAGRRSGMRPGTRSGLWADFKAAIAVLRPKVVVIENVRGLLSGCAESDSDVEPCPGCVGDGQHRPVVRALGRVLGDLAALGFDAEWGSLRAADVGAPHGRFRVFVVAYRRGVRLGAGRGSVAGEASGGWSSTVDSGRGDAPVTLLPTLRAAATRSSRSAMTGPGMSGLSIEQAIEVAQGILPREFNSWDEVRLLPTPQAHDERGGKTPEQVAAMRARGHGVSNLNEVTVNELLPTPQVAEGNVVAEVAWGPYEPAIRRWETILGRPAPSPTKPDGKNGNHRLNAEFTSWMMGYPAGWVTDVIGRNPAIKACGNGVVPQQAYAALEALWARVESLGVAA